VISAMEAHMPARLFDGEWRVLEAKRYKSTTETDMQTAQFFLLLFVTVTLLAAGVAVSQIVRG
jgi:predicted lysophospholipase L1 biosynthesis ABC-type transport system permease subunit